MLQRRSADCCSHLSIEFVSNPDEFNGCQPLLRQGPSTSSEKIGQRETTREAVGTNSAVAQVKYLDADLDWRPVVEA